MNVKYNETKRKKSERRKNREIHEKISHSCDEAISKVIKERKNRRTNERNVIAH